MPAPSSKPQLPFFDFALPLIVKLPTVLLSELLLPTVLLAAIFYGLRWLGLLSISVYAGEVSLALVLGFCVLAALRFNSLQFASIRLSSCGVCVAVERPILFFICPIRSLRTHATAKPRHEGQRGSVQSPSSRPRRTRFVTAWCFWGSTSRFSISLARTIRLP